MSIIQSAKLNLLQPNKYIELNNMYKYKEYKLDKLLSTIPDLPKEIYLQELTK